MKEYWRRRIDALHRQEKDTCSWAFDDRYLLIGSLVWDHNVGEAHFSLPYKPSNILIADAMVDGMHDLKHHYAKYFDLREASNDTH